MKKSDKQFVMDTAAIECSIAENIPLSELTVRKSVRNDGSWVILITPQKR